MRYLSPLALVLLWPVTAARLDLVRMPVYGAAR
jgi:hypothetical protein